MRWSGWLLLVLLGGCSGAAKPVSLPDWDPPGVADRAMELFDSDGDGFLSQDELVKSPGLLVGLKNIDTDGDKKLSADELAARFAVYEKKQLGLTGREFRVTYKNRPLSDANVKLVPEPFLEGVIEAASGVTLPNGIVNPQAGVDGLPGMRPGYYRVEVTSNAIDLPSKYNSDTVLGAEVSPARDDSNPFQPKPIQLAD